MQGRPRAVPSPQGLAAWCRLFRRADTYSNYVSYLKLGRLVLNLDTSSLDHPLVKRAKAAVRKTQAPPRERRFIQAPLLKRLMLMAIQQQEKTSVFLYLAAYSFLLRVPSECLPIVIGEHPDKPLEPCVHSCLGADDNEVVLRLAGMKNRLHGSVIRRGCERSTQPRLCPVHVLGKWVRLQKVGSEPFEAISPASARATLQELGLADSHAYCLHDMRRGHAQDLVEAGSSLQQILKASEWVGPAFLKYLDAVKVEKAAVVQAHMDDSEEDDMQVVFQHVSNT